MERLKKLFFRISNDINRALKKGLLDIVGAGVINKLLVLLTTVIIVRLLSKNEYGIFSYGYNFINIVAIFSSLGMNSVMLQFAAEEKDKDKRNYIYKFTIIVGVICNTLVACAVWGYSLLSKEVLTGSNSVICGFSFIILPQFLFQSVTNYYRAEMDNKKYRQTTNLNSLFYCILASAGAYIFAIPGTIAGRYLGFCVAVLFGVAVSIPDFCLIIKSHRYSEFNTKGIFSYGLTITLTNAVSQILYSVDVLLVGLIVGSSDIVADYKTATVLPFALAFVPQMVVTFIYPHFARNNKDKDWIKKNTVRIVKYLSSFNAVICLFGIVFAPIIIKIVFGEEYLSSVVCFRILMVSYFFSGTFRVLLGNILFMLHKVKVNFYIGVIDAVANIILDYFLITQYGSIGAAIATMTITIIDSVLSGAYLLYYLNRKKEIIR